MILVLLERLWTSRFGSVASWLKGYSLPYNNVALLVGCRVGQYTYIVQRIGQYIMRCAEFSPGLVESGWVGTGMLR